jgi:dipeptidyl-peptidase-2
LNPQFNWALDTFGGRNPNKDFLHLENIVFTNGDLDPWRAGGLTHPVPGNDDIHVALLKGGAHHLDLRLPNDEFDPQDVKDVRKFIEEALLKWIADWRQSPFPRDPALYPEEEVAGQTPVEVIA